MKKTVIACVIASIFAASLTGCGKSDEQLRMEAQAAAYERLQAAQEQQKQEEAEADKLAAEQAAADEKELAGVVAELKKGDPLVRDAYYGFNEKGDRVLHVVRDNPPQTQQAAQTAMGSNGQPVIINNQPAQQASSGVSETIWPLVAGAGAGMLLANAMNSSGGYDRYRDSHSGYSNRYYNDDNDYRRNRTTIVNQYHTTNVRNVKTAYKYPDSPAAKAFTNQSGYKPAKIAPSASSYGQAKTLTSPAARQYQTQAKPAQIQSAPPKQTSPANSYWSQSKPQTQTAQAQPKAQPKAQSNSFWGSNTKSSPASSSGSSFKSSSSSSSSFGSSRSSSSSFKSSGSSFRSSSRR